MVQGCVNARPAVRGSREAVLTQLVSHSLAPLFIPTGLRVRATRRRRSLARRTLSSPRGARSSGSPGTSAMGSSCRRTQGTRSTGIMNVPFCGDFTLTNKSVLDASLQTEGLHWVCDTSCLHYTAVFFVAGGAWKTKL